MVTLKRVPWSEPISRPADSGAHFVISWRQAGAVQTYTTCSRCTAERWYRALVEDGYTPSAIVVYFRRQAA